MGDVPKSIWWGLAFGVAAFVVHVILVSQSAGTCTYFDFGAIGLGGLALLCGLRALLKSENRLGIGLAVFVVLLGIFQVARGLGWILAPC